MNFHLNAPALDPKKEHVHSWSASTWIKLHVHGELEPSNPVEVQ